MKKLNIFKNLDQFLFSKLEKLQDHPEYQKINDAYAAAEERIQEVVKALLAISIIAIPLLVISFFSMSNSSLRENLKLKEEIISMSHEYIQEQALIRSAESSILGRKTVLDQGELQTKITSVVNSSGVDSANIQVSNFEANDLKGNIIEARMNLKYTSLSNDNLFNLLSGLVNREKIKIDTLVINKNQATNLLDGLLTIYYFSKDEIDE